jgi:hypothetical protein
LASDLQRGVCLVGGPRRFTEDAFERLVQTNVTWVSLTPFGWQESPATPEVRLATEGRVWWGESDEGLRETIDEAKRHGLKTILKPHIWIRRRSDGWRGTIAFERADDWDRWWASYRTFILHYAELASVEGVDAFCVGTELHSTAASFPDRWRGVIREVRARFDGPLTYSANWYDEFEDVAFWDDLDFIGVQAYFPLATVTEREAGRVVRLVAAWAPHARSIEAVQKRFDLPVLFTEVGYRSTADAAEKPWEWWSEAPIDPGLQADCFEAMFEVFWDRPWFAGAYIWKWYPYEGRRPGRRERDFTPQGKPAEEVLRSWYGRQ